MGPNRTTRSLAFIAVCVGLLQRSRPAISVSRVSRPSCSPLPGLTPTALAKLAEIAQLEKGGTAWENEPRVPAGQPDGGRWTTAGGAGGAPAVGAKPEARGSPRAPASSQKPALPLDDGVYRPRIDAPHVILTGGEGRKRSRLAGRTGRLTISILEDVFPGLRDKPTLAIPLAPIDGFLGGSAGR